MPRELVSRGQPIKQVGGMAPGVGGQQVPGAAGQWSPLQTLLGAQAISKGQPSAAWGILGPPSEAERQVALERQMNEEEEEYKVKNIDNNHINNFHFIHPTICFIY